MKILCLVLLFSQIARADHFQVLEAVSKPEIQTADLPKFILVKKTEIHTDFKIKTLKNQFAKFRLGQGTEISVFSETEASFSIKDSKKSSAGFSVEVMSGQIYINKNSNSFLDLKSDFFDWSLNKDQSINLVIQFDKNAAKINFCNKDKPFEISLFDHEKKITLGTLDSVQFQGIIENQKLAYDILLNQRKIPKGHWQDIKKCNFSEINDQEKKLMLAEIADLNKIKQNIQKIKNKKIFDDSKYLCQKPYGQFNECLWQKIDKKCLRYRCNAQGLWSDTQVVSIDKSSQCEAKPVVLACDY